MRDVTDEMVEEAVADGWSEEDAKRGYGVFSSNFGNGATHVEKLDCMNIFDSDDDAAKQAEKDGMKIIRDLELPERDKAHYLDTPENRALLDPLRVK